MYFVRDYYYITEERHVYSNWVRSETHYFLLIYIYAVLLFCPLDGCISVDVCTYFDKLSLEVCDFWSKAARHVDWTHRSHVFRDDVVVQTHTVIILSNTVHVFIHPKLNLKMIGINWLCSGHTTSWYKFTSPCSECVEEIHE